MGEARPEQGPEGEAESLEVLRAKYHDYCSAQLADLLLFLSPDEIYLLAETATRETGVPHDSSYEEMVAHATRWLARKMTLPPFEVWLEDYREHPRDYEEYFMGLWELDMKARVDG